jgi:hypothetical protein
MSGFAQQAGGYKQISATGNVSAYPAKIVGIFVSSASSTPTITVYDSATTTTSTKVVDTFTPAGATFYAIPAATSAGIYVVIGGTVSATVIYA